MKPTVATKTLLCLAIVLSLVSPTTSFYFYPRARVFEPYAGILVPHEHAYGLVPTHSHSRMNPFRDPLVRMARDPLLTSFSRAFDELAHDLDRSLDEMNQVIAGMQTKLPELTVERPEKSDSTRLTIKGVAADQLEVTVDHALLTLTMTSADGSRRVSRGVQLPRNVVDASVINAAVQGDTLVVDVPDIALEPISKPVRASIDVQRLDTKLPANDEPADAAPSASADATQHAATEQPEEEMMVYDVPDDL
eukprot:CAMPEP_0119406554 /NCGR_PEP_ID=MMETSP1335-20130426/833_1 /TAXON_ID=259385 /ORGANISM="Chrysoculter rhomboideus, Strain RCC1486" /LENGTH=249 /DNA_ID=CAMNT_0007430637 /DNA_START=78 /DNA_END=827 /DNA_ORIENTATION=-